PSAIVTPLFGQPNRDIAQLMERGMTRKDPVVLPAAIRFGAGAAVVTGLGQIVDQIPQMFAMRKFARPGHGKHIGIVLLRPWKFTTGKHVRDLVQHLPKSCSRAARATHLMGVDALTGAFSAAPCSISWAMSRLSCPRNGVTMGRRA